MSESRAGTGAAAERLLTAVAAGSRCARLGAPAPVRRVRGVVGEPCCDAVPRPRTRPNAPRRRVAMLTQIAQLAGAHTRRPRRSYYPRRRMDEHAPERSTVDALGIRPPIAYAVEARDDAGRRRRADARRRARPRRRARRARAARGRRGDRRAQRRARHGRGHVRGLVRPARAAARRRRAARGGGGAGPRRGAAPRSRGCSS